MANRAALPSAMVDRRSEAVVVHPRGLVGLRNLGNTCFMSCILQCLFSCGPLLVYFTEKFDPADLNVDNTMKGDLAKEFARLCREVRVAPKYTSISPTTLKDLVAKWAPQFTGFQQQDSHEFLRFFIDGLHEDLSRIRTKPQYEELKTIVGESVQDGANRWWKHIKDRSDSVIFDVFGGQLMSEVTCKVCGRISRAFDSFLDLQVPIPQTNSASVDLSECFNAMVQQETLEGDEMVTCEGCEKRTPGTKSMCLYRLPNVLVVHLKRFSYTSWRRNKVATLVTCSPHVVDVRPYCFSDLPEQSSSQYQLFGVAQHVGSLSGGHYTACCRTEMDQWYQFNDTQVSSASDALGGSSAYVLFFHKLESSEASRAVRSGDSGRETRARPRSPNMGSSRSLL
jgi:ubiquitin C-terminal hydrolase